LAVNMMRWTRGAESAILQGKLPEGVVATEDDNFSSLKEFVDFLTH
jgi:hypothetical protein